MCSFERDRGKGGNRVHGSSIELGSRRRVGDVKRTNRSGPKSQHTLEAAGNRVVLTKLMKISCTDFIVRNDISPCLVHARFACVPQGDGFDLKSVSDQACKLCTNFFAPVHHDDVPAGKVKPLQSRTLTFGLSCLLLDASSKMTGSQCDGYKYHGGDPVLR